MPTQSARFRGLRPSMLLFAAVVGVGLGCARATTKEGVWFDACCTTCSGGACEDCSETKGDCGDRILAECLIDNGVMMCRPKPAARQ